MNDQTSTYFDKLLKLSNRYQASAPFTPYAGDLYETNRITPRFPSVMWSGSATAGWGVGQIRPKLYYDSMLMTRYFVLNELKPNKTGFWHSIFQFSQHINEHLNLGLGSNFIARSGVIFNNLFKVSSLSGEPAGQLRSTQIDICRDIFLLEIKDHKPEYVVLHIGSLADEMVEAIMGSATAGWEQVSPSVWRCDTLGTPVLWVDRKRDELQGKRGQQVADLILNDYQKTNIVT